VEGIDSPGVCVDVFGVDAVDAVVVDMEAERRDSRHVDRSKMRFDRKKAAGDGEDNAPVVEPDRATEPALRVWRPVVRVTAEKEKEHRGWAW
jgi:hypothetical protein